MGPVACVLVSEIFPLEAKGFLMTFPVATNFICNIIVNALFPVMTKNMGTGITFAIFGLICVISVIFVWFLVPETKGISLEKIEENWKNGVAPNKF